MDIRIGNDVCVQIPVSEFGDINVEDIKRMKCTFIKTRDICPCDDSSHPVFHHSTQYTVRSCGHPSYYAYPCNTRGYCINEDPHCGFVVCDSKSSCSFTSRCKIIGETINAYFPAEFQKCLGTYKCVFEIKVKEEGWDYDNLHTYSTSYEDIFTFKKTGVQTGSITIRPLSTEKFDTYIIAMTDSDLSKHSDDYAGLILKSDGFRLVTLPNGIREVSILSNKNRIIVISAYDSLQLRYNSYIFPSTMYQLDNGYFMYVSDNTYSNLTIDLQLINTGESNSVTPGLPEFESSEDPDEPTDPDQPDTPTEPTNGNKLDGTTIITSSVLNEVTLSQFGTLTDYTLIV